VGEVEKRSVKCTGLASHASLLTRRQKVKSEVQAPAQVVPDVVITNMHIKDNVRCRPPIFGG
jgi:hypothetical protein